MCRRRVIIVAISRAGEWLDLGVSGVGHRWVKGVWRHSQPPWVDLATGVLGLTVAYGHKGSKHSRPTTDPKAGDTRYLTTETFDQFHKSAEVAVVSNVPASHAQHLHSP